MPALLFSLNKEIVSLYCEELRDLLYLAAQQLLIPLCVSSYLL